MSWNNKDKSREHIEERGFEVTVDGERVPGVYWTSKTGSNDRLVLLGHGGSRHKKADYIVDMANQLGERGIASMAIDGPGHGERGSGSEAGSLDDFVKTWNNSGGTERVLKDWRTALDFIESEFSARPTAWWGLSMGTMMGLPVTATDKRIQVAVLGLMGNQGLNADDLTRLAPEVSCPIRFLVQWDDELVPRDSCLELFDAIGSRKKTLHANPGKHIAVPHFEFSGSVDYFDKHLH